ncbi:MAG: hypothetical protein M0R75_11730 [Dehalococcoidia bacterium]|nr:hypothetical protein [Dehalococcoidia bacterium]
MKAISFGWTTLPLLAGEKTVTRREWKDTYATQWWVGTRFYMLDKDYRYGGVRLGIGEITATPSKELACDAPAEDYAREGFEWFERHPEAIPAPFLKRLGVQHHTAPHEARAVLRGFLQQHELFWVVRFTPVEWFVDPDAELAARMESIDA